MMLRIVFLDLADLFFSRFLGSSTTMDGAVFGLVHDLTKGSNMPTVQLSFLPKFGQEELCCLPALGDINDGVKISSDYHRRLFYVDFRK